MPLPQVSVDSVAGVSAGVTIGTVVVVSTGTKVGMITGPITVFGGEISGENTLPLQVILLVPAMLLMSGSSFSKIESSSANQSCLTP